MSVGKKIKQLRELRNFTQSYMAEKLSLSLGGYSKIERNETDVTLSRLNQIAKVLDTDIATILNFDSKQVFNQYNNKSATANGVVQNQQIIADQGLDEFFNKMKDDINFLRTQVDDLKKNK